MTSKVDRATFKLRYSHTVGIVAMEGRGFSNPVDLAISRDGRMYVASRANAAQEYGVRIGICDLESEYFGDFGSYGTGDGQFVWPTSLGFDGQDRLYLADEHNHRVTSFDTDGNFQAWWGEHGEAEGQLNGPSGLAFDSDDHIWVADSRNHRIQKFTPDGQLLLASGEEGSDDGQLNLPWGIAVDSNDNVYVADWRNDRVQKFYPDGRVAGRFGQSGHGDGELRRPAGVAVDPDGYVYVADWGNERVQVFGPDGSFQLKLRGEATLSKWADDFYEANPDEKQARDASVLEPKMGDRVRTAHDESARMEKYFWGPVSVTLDREGRLYVTEANRHRIQIYERIS